VRAVPQSGQGPESALALRGLADAALASLEASRRRIDDLNVYPVADGDTGTNMTLTVRAVADALARSGATNEQELVREVTRAALIGARGNSGVILSQLLRGAAESLAAAPKVDARALAAALRAASDSGYASVLEPQEGTILTVARAVAERAEGLELPLGDALAEVVAAGDEALALTPEQLPLLREAGVVDAGALGFVEILRGITAHVRGEPLPEAAPEHERVPRDAIHRQLSRYRYCTTFFVEGPAVDPRALESGLAAFGDSLLVVGGAGEVKVHVHTDDPGRALTLATAAGVVEEVEIENMHVQTAAREQRLAQGAARTAVVAIAAGAGNRRLFESMGALVVDGGSSSSSMNPSTAAIVAAAESAHAAEVLVLPNDARAVGTARRAVAAASRPARVVPTRSLQAGLGAMVAYEPLRGAVDNAREMAAAANGVRAGAVTVAARASEADGVEVAAGDFVGRLDGKVVAAGASLVRTALVVAEALAAGAGIVTILVGEEAPPPDAIVEALRAGDEALEVEVHEGGQPHDLYLLAAE
jgi:DAK2 domain fusion protein YloV